MALPLNTISISLPTCLLSELCLYAGASTRCQNQGLHVFVILFSFLRFSFHLVDVSPWGRKPPQCGCFFFLFASECVCARMCVIIMSWSEAIWVGWLVCISGVNHYTYSWPGFKLAWIFILSPGRRRVEWVWFQSAEQKLTQPFVWWVRALDDCRGPVGMPSELPVYVDYCIC